MQTVSCEAVTVSAETQWGALNPTLSSKRMKLTPILHLCLLFSASLFSCNGAVYAAEEVIGAGSKWHTACFACKECKVRLSSTTLTEKEGEIYCQTCYAKNFGPRGYGIGSQSLTFTGQSVSGPSQTISSPPATTSSSVSRPAPAAATAGFCCGARVTGKFCGECGSAVAASAAAASGSAPTAAPAAVVSPPAKTWNQSVGIVRPVVKIGTSGDRCPKCNDRVYDAEKVVAGGKSWHSACFRCESCRAGLNSTNLNDKDGKLFCNSCYSKAYGPKGYGFSGGGATTFAHTS